MDVSRMVIINPFVNAVITVPNNYALKSSNVPDNTKNVCYNKPKVAGKPYSNLNRNVFVNQTT